MSTHRSGSGLSDGAAPPAHGFPVYGRGERLADAAVHAAGLVLGPAAGLWLLASLPEGSTFGQGAALAAYVLGMTGMLAASAAYNLAPPGPVKERLRRLDHALIFAAIAGTYTPLLALRLVPPLGPSLCAGVWALALAGAALKLAAPRRWERTGLALYLALGWIGLPALPDLAGALRPETLQMIGAGAGLYTLGAGIHLLERLRFHNALWHAFVLAAAGCHFLAMRAEFVPPG